MSVFPVFDTVDSPYERKFAEPHEVGWRSDVPLVFCGHFDGHDVYRQLSQDRFVVVYASDPSAAFEVTWQMASYWLANNPNMTEWGTMRAVVKARGSLVQRLDELVWRLRAIVERHPDDTSLGAIVCDTCGEAADWIETLKKEAAL